MLQNFWNWYIALYKNSDPKVVIATIAMTFAALTFILNFILKPLFGRIKRKSAKIDVQAFHSITAANTILGPLVGNWEIELRITNKSNQQFYINNPKLETRQEINGSKLHSTLSVYGVFPAPLQPGQQFKQIYSANNNVFRSLNENDKVRYVVTDTTGGKYYSKYYKIRELKR